MNHRAFLGAALETVLVAAGVGVWEWDLSSGRVRWSAETALLFGLSPDRVDVRFQDFEALVFPEDLSFVRARIEAAIESRSKDFAVEHRVALPDGTMRWVEGRGRVVTAPDGTPIGMIGAVLDITARKRDEERLLRSEERYRLFTELATDYVYVVDIKQPLLAPSIVAGAFERTTGYTPEEIAQLGGWIQVMHPDDRQNADQLFATLRSGRTFVNEYRIVTKAGEVRWLRDRAQPIVDANTGELLQLVGGVQDITERKTLEEQLNHAYKIEALARLAGSVAHDFNNLLTVMYSAVAMVDSGNQAPRQSAALSDLNQAISRAADLTASLLAFARKRPSVPRVSLLGDALNKAAPMLQRAVGERIGLSVGNRAPDVRISVDASQLDVALLNLAINARDAMPNGGELLIVGHVVDFSRSDRRRPPELPPTPHAAIDVIDHGTGIAPEVRQRLFEPFFTTKEAGQGTGLGLATVHGIARQSGGAVAVETTLGRGSVFTIYLPIATAPMGAPEPSTTRHSIGGTECVVVVEDEPMVRRMVVRVLEDLGYRVQSFATAEDVLALPADEFAQIDLLLSDIRLPGMPGTELATVVTKRRPQLAVVLMSGLIEDAEQQSVVSSGRFRLLQKPFMADGLARCLREALENR